MKFGVHTVAACLLAASLVVSYASASGQTAPATRHAATKKAATSGPTVEEQIQQLRQEFQGQIDGLKSSLAEKDEQLRQAQQAAADAKASADKAQAAADAQQSAVTENTTAVDTLKSSVKDINDNSAVIVSTMVDNETKAVKKNELSDLAFGKVKIGATVFADWSYWANWDGSTNNFTDNMNTPSSINDERYNVFEITRAYVNLLYTPTDAVSLRITPDITRDSGGNLYYRLKYATIDLNTPFAKLKSFKDGKITFGQTQEPLVDWEEGLTGHRYIYKMPMDFAAGLSSTYRGVRVRGPVKVNGKEYLDTDIGVFTNASYSSTELSGTKQLMGRMTYYPVGTKADRTGFGVTIFGNLGFTNVAPSAPAASHYKVDRMVVMGSYQTQDKGYLITGQYDFNHNLKGDGTTQKGFAFEGNARLGSNKSPFHAFGLYQYYEPFSGASNNDSTKFTRVVGGIGYKINKNLDFALTSSNMLWNQAAGKNDTNVVSVFSQYNF